MSQAPRRVDSVWIGPEQPRAEKGCNILMTALQAYVCWRMDAGVVGCWALLLLGLATERVGATNALVAAMHKIAATARVRGMVIARLQRFGCASRVLVWLLVSKAARSYTYCGLSDCSVP